jgi:hypothetical protein
MIFSIRDDLRYSVKNDVILQIFPDIMRFCILITEVQKCRNDGNGCSRFESGKLYAMSLMDDPDFAKISSYQVLEQKRGPVACSKLISIIEEENDQSEHFVADHVKFFANLLPGKQVLKYVKFENGRFFASVKNEDIQRWISQAFLTIDELDKLRTLGMIYGKLNPGEIEAMSSVRNIESTRKYIKYNLEHWSTPYYRACREFGPTANSKKLSEIDELLRESGDWTRAARTKADNYEIKIPKCKSAIEGIINELNTTQRVLAKCILDSFVIENRNRSFLEVKHWAIILNEMTTAFRRSINIFINYQLKTNTTIEHEPQDDFINYYMSAVQDDIARGTIEQQVRGIYQKILEFNSDPTKMTVTVHFGTLFNELARLISADMDITLKNE